MTNELPSQEEQQEQEQQKDKKPEGLFRKSGIAALVITATAVGASGYLFADNLVKFALKQGMELSFGAQADIAEVEVSWSPFGVTVKGVAQTDASEPNKNLFELQSASAQVDFWQLLLGKYVVEQLTAEQLAFATERASAGQVFEHRLSLSKSSSESVVKVTESLGLSVPSTEDLLASLDLQTEKKGRALEQTWKEEKPKLEAAFKQLPNEDTLKELKADWKRIEDLDLKSPEDFDKLKKALEQLKVKVDKEREAVKHAKAQYKDSKNKIDTAYKALQQAAKDDWKRVEEQVPFDDPNAVALAKMLFGDEVAGYIEQAQSVWQKVQPYLDQKKEQKAMEQQAQAGKWSQSKNIEFPLEQAWPSWIVKQLNVSTLLKGNVYQIKGSEINVESYVRNQPSLYQVTLNDEFKLTGLYFVDQSMKVETSGDWSVTDLAVKQRALSDSKDLKLALSKATLGGQGQYAYKDKLDARNKLVFTDADFNGEARTRLAQLTLDTLTGVNSFNLDLGVTGNLDKPNISVKSDLDKQLSSAFKSAFNQEWGKVKQQTQAKLQAKLNSQFGLEDTDLAQFQEQLSGTDKELDVFGTGSVEDMIKQQTKAYEKKLKEKAKDKLKDKLKSLFGG